MKLAALLQYFESFNGIDVLVLLACGIMGFLVCRSINREAIAAHRELARLSKRRIETIQKEHDAIDAELTTEREKLRLLEKDLLTAKNEIAKVKIKNEKSRVSRQLDFLILQQFLFRLGCIIPLFQAFYAASRERNETTLDNFITESSNLFYLASSLSQHLEKLRTEKESKPINSMATDRHPAYLEFIKKADEFIERYNNLAERYLPSEQLIDASGDREDSEAALKENQ